MNLSDEDTFKSKNIPSTQRALALRWEETVGSITITDLLWLLDFNFWMYSISLVRAGLGQDTAV